jgi:hypothetical protein
MRGRRPRKTTGGDWSCCTSSQSWRPDSDEETEGEEGRPRMDKAEVLRRRATARRRLLAALDGFDEDSLTRDKVCGHWTVEEVLAHVSGWSRWDFETITALRAGESADLSPLDDIDRFNDQVVTERSGWTVGQILDEMKEVKAAMNRLIADLPEETIAAPAPHICQYWETLADWLLVASWHEEEHAAELEAWQTL